MPNIDNTNTDYLVDYPKALYRMSGRYFYGTENEKMAGFGPVGNTDKKSLDRL